MVSIRERELKDGRISLMLDIYVNGVRDVKSLKIYLLPDKGNSAIKVQNKENRRKAEIVRVRKENEIIDNKYDIPSLKYSSLGFLDYFKSLVQKRRASIGNHDFMKHSTFINVPL